MVLCHKVRRSQIPHQVLSKMEADEMNIYIYQGYAFADMGDGYMLCISTEAEVKAADENRIAEMIAEAVAINQSRQQKHLMNQPTQGVH